MEKEYYTPEISELFVGYECQIIQIGNPKEVWLESLIDNTSKFIRYDYLIKNKALRTKYLDKQDIIDLGFTTPAYTDCEGYEYYKFLEDFTEVRIVLNGYEDYSKITIKYDLDSVFEGICKSKNELKKLMKDYLNIPI